MHIVVEVNGGAVQAVYADRPDGVTVTLVDWDNHEAGGLAACETDVEPMTAMPEDTAQAVGGTRPAVRSGR